VSRFDPVNPTVVWCSVDERSMHTQPVGLPLVETANEICVRARQSRGGHRSGRLAHRRSSRLGASGRVWWSADVRRPRGVANHARVGQVKGVSAMSRKFRRVRWRPRPCAARVSGVDLALFAVGWSVGWLLLWRLRPLPKPAPRTTSSGVRRPPIAVIVPARNEAGVLPHLLPRMTAQLGPDDELVVVDDHSTDTTKAVAIQLGARVVDAPDLPPGWLGKPHACCVGVEATSAPILLFLDADVRPAEDLLDRIALAHEADPARSSRCSRGTRPAVGRSRPACWPTRPR
jgi:hypothetical protein